MSAAKLLSRIKRSRKPVSSVTARIDSLVCNVLNGWVWDSASPESALSLQVISAGRVVGESVADNFRGDLAQAGIGNGKHGFSIALDDGFRAAPGTAFKLVEKHSQCDLTAGEIRVGSLAGYGDFPGIACIDYIDHQRVVGSIFDPRKPAYAPRIQILANNEVIGEGKASAPRQDQLSGIKPDTEHTFSVIPDQTVFDGKEHIISVVDKDNGRLLGKNLYRIGGNPVASLHINKADADGVSGIVELHRPLPGGSCTVSLFADNEFIASGICGKTESSDVLHFSFTLAGRLFDARAHVFEARIWGHPVRTVPFTDVLQSVKSSWSGGSSSSLQPGYASQSKVASYRYESLRQSLKLAGDSAKAVSNLQRAHDVVVEGYENRQVFPHLILPQSQSPTISIVVPVFNQFALTYHCIASTILAANHVSWEMIVVDDCSTDQTLELESMVDNVVVISNEDNQGFLHSCNRGAEAARGDYVVFLNNDTEVTSFWLDEMLAVFDRFSGVGAVGSKLIYPDGVLQDAGGIVWNNGLPWNVGHGQNADHPAYNYTREVDYLTGASLMVSMDAWHRVEGFSTEYAPAYYEDTDLAFKIREAGLRTFYCPHSTVVHFEGQSNGRDLNAGVKQYQTLNAARFTKRWIDVLHGNGDEGVDLHLNKDRNRPLRILMLDHAFPCVGQDAGSYAAVQEIKLMMDLGAKITFVPYNFTHVGAHTDELQKMGVECVYSPFCTSITVFLQERGSEFDAVYITRYNIACHVLPEVRQYTKAKIIFNNADLHFLRELRAAESAGETDMSGPLATREKELAVMQEVDAILSYNETEHEIIASHTMRSDNIFKCPWVLQDHSTEPGFAQRHGMAFLGGFGHPPNREALEYFVAEVMPLLRQSGQQIPLRVYGSNIPAELEALGAPDIQIIGYAESLGEVFDDCRVFVAPLLSGAGIKGKVLDSLAYGVPTVLSPVAVESTGLVHGVSTLVASTPQQWVDHIITLHNNKDDWQQTREAASILLEKEYSHTSGLQRMRRVFDYIGLESIANQYLATSDQIALDSAA